MDDPGPFGVKPGKVGGAFYDKSGNIHVSHNIYNQTFLGALEFPKKRYSGGVDKYFTNQSIIRKVWL